jgi:hypothetical protein
MSDPKQDHGPDNPLYYAPHRLSEQNDQADPVVATETGTDNKVWSAPPTPHENVAQLHPVRGQDLQTRKQSDIFAEAVARAERRQLEPELVELPSLLQSRRSVGIVTKYATTVAGAALVALIYAVAFPTSQAPVEDSALSAQTTQTTWQRLRSSLLPASPRKPAPTLIVRNNSGYINEPLELGVSVDSPAPGMAVMIKSMLAGVRLTAGKRVSANEWRVPAQDISHTAIIPPTDFVGEMNLSAELYTADGATLVTTFVRLTWASAQSDSAAAVVATSTAATPLAPVAAAPPGPVAPAPPQPQALATPPQAAAAVATPQARAEPIQELSPNEIAGLVRRAQELLASGDLQGARVLLKRAAEAQNARAALLLAKTFDPIALRQLSTADPGPDLAQARNWYQRAKEWGSPEAQRQLDALASYPRR